MKKPFNVLHTSDWHLGKMLYNQRRDEEFSQFLDFLLLKLEEEEINLLLISGDIFDTTTPSNASLALYHGFLAKAQLIVDNIVIIAGNHDSPSLLAS
ncbi:MAG: exonuclease subunit SbcD, partial [Spirochaetales bacterium]|nr:exonuclease subunit SbcD [Spirochaetales bacterium]